MVVQRTIYRIQMIQVFNTSINLIHIILQALRKRIWKDSAYKINDYNHQVHLECHH